ncbi:tetratricopeptide repeat protein [Opitutus sp. ER46]|uniref:cytochrome c3 family protein n=1 Tax=Opitutus sp. ER46 TaxID=2161864 RepID=UPI000D2F8CB3|nr:tetratricopeptide repeat protein [Opitutus sp. ER46]PTY00116.1 ammonia-forming cytochrome c nitrite reductase subunit c552 [Opitutus sp. ER46]
MPPSPARKRLLTWLLAGGSTLLLLGAAWQLGALFWSLRARPTPPPRPLARNSASCQQCHADIHRAWADSHHAKAHRPFDVAQDAEAFTPRALFALHDVTYQLRLDTGKPAFSEQRAGQPADTYTADFVLGHTPLRQYIVPTGRGRYQASEIAYDPARKDWFNVFGNERRQPGEWGHWRGRGMNWNSMCAQCHLTDFAKNYEPATDAYASTWLEHGVGCVQCHDGLTPDHATPGYRTPPALWRQATDRARATETCAPCHARNEVLVGEPRPGLAYFDHFRVTLPVDAATFYPDGQVRDEDFNWTSLLTSRMGGKARVTCLDCHDPHSGKTRLPAATNALCQQCHGQPNPRNAPIIDPLAHSHHKPDSTGNQCVACHMPTTTYMQRDPRHDHGFLKPDPLLTKELGIPNACDRCHADRGIDWQIAANAQWYGAKLDSRQRARARAVAAAQRGAPEAPARLLALIAGEDVPAWKATLLQLTLPWAADPAVTQAAQAARADPHPLVRAEAVRLLAAANAAPESVRAALQDTSRLVRLEAAWALARDLPADAPARADLDAYLRFNADQPLGQVQLGQARAARGETAAAEACFRQAIAWDPNSPGIRETLALFLNEQGDAAGAAAEFWRAAQLAPSNAHLAFEAALTFAASNRLPDAELALREAVRRDAMLHRAWYNLGLLLAQTGRAAEGITALERAEHAAPDVADYPYARATILWGQGQPEAARAAARRALAIDPAYAPARELAR